MDTTTRFDADQPLAGIRVLDLSRLLPGPYCSLLLARMGAEVVKVETPLAGDYARMAPDELGFAGVFEAVNRGKRSIAVDYRKPGGRDLILKLVKSADVFLESSRPGQLWMAFCRGLGREDLVSRQFDPAAAAEVATAILTRPSRAWLQRFDADACVALVKLPAEALQDDYIRARSFSGGGTAPAPRLGADTDDVLAEAGIAPSLVQRLMHSGVVTGEQTPQRAARAKRLGSMLARMAERGEASAA